MSDLTTNSAEQEPKKASKEILRSEIDEGLDAIERDQFQMFVSALAAGMEIGFSVMLMAAMMTHEKANPPQPVTEILNAGMYSVGFIFVVLGRSELFTEQTTLAVLPVLDRKTSFGALLQLWGIVCGGNLLGAMGFARMVTALAYELKEIDPQTFVRIARPVVDHGSVAIFFSAVFAGWLMGLLSWLVAAAKDTISQIVIIVLITTCIGFCGLHHTVVGAVELFAAAFISPDFRISEIARVLSMAILGNIVGGTFFVALLKYGHANVHEQAGAKKRKAKK